MHTHTHTYNTLYVYAHTHTHTYNTLYVYAHTHTCTWTHVQGDEREVIVPLGKDSKFTLTGYVGGRWWYSLTPLTFPSSSSQAQCSPAKSPTVTPQGGRCSNRVRPSPRHPIPAVRGVENSSPPSSPCRVTLAIVSGSGDVVYYKLSNGITPIAKADLKRGGNSDPPWSQSRLVHHLLHCQCMEWFVDSTHISPTQLVCLLPTCIRMIFSHNH